MGLRKKYRWFELALAGMILFALPLAGQVKVGDNLSLTGTGTVSSGYSATYGDQIGSSHGLDLGFSGGLNGYYYNPNFLSFNINPYFNQSRSNSESASVTDASGVNIGTSIFAGSHFPGAINYSLAYNNTGNYGVPGLADFSTDSKAQNFGITWSELIPKYPTLTAGFQMGTNNYSLYGTNENGNSSFRSLYLNSSYQLHGFNLSGGVSRGSSEALIPGVFLGEQEASSHADTTTYSFNASHRLPWNGSFAAAVSRADMNSDYLGYNFNGTIDRIGMSAGLMPTAKLHLSLSGDYTDNLSGSLYQIIVPTAAPGGAPPAPGPVAGSALSSSQQSSSSRDLMFNATYSFAPQFQATGSVERRDQFYLGASYGSTLYSGGLTYTRELMGGYLGSSVSVIDSTLDKSAQNMLGVIANANYNRQFGRWQVGGFVSYSQNVQTLLVAYTTSSINFSGNASRKFGRFTWTVGGGASRTLLTAQPGAGSSSGSFSSSIGTRRISLAGTYSQSSGNSLVTGSGLVPTPLPPVIPSAWLVLYGGHSYSFTASGSPLRRLMASASYVRAQNDLTNQGVASWNQFEEQTLSVQYRLRQLGFTGGYTRLVQGFSASGLPPAHVSSFYIGVYRWFNFF